MGLFTKDTQHFFAETLKDLRQKAKLKQEGLADVLGVSRATISYYENCQRIPDILFISKVADYFHTSVDFLLGRVPARSSDPDMQIAMNYTGLNESIIDQLHTIVENSEQAQQLWCLNAFSEEFNLQEFVATLEKLYTFSFAAHLLSMAINTVDRECYEHNQAVSEEEKQQLVLAKLSSITAYYSSDKLMSEMLSFLISPLKSGETPEFSTIPVNPADIFSYTLKNIFDFALEEFAAIGHTTYPSKQEMEEFQLHIPANIDYEALFSQLINYPSNETEGAENG